MGNESRAFSLPQGLELQSVVSYVESYLTTDKHMMCQSSETTDGYVLQASQPSDGWKTISGTRLAITVYFRKAGDFLNVTVGEGQWSDKIGAGAVGLFLAWPMLIPAGVGAFRQKKLPQEIFATVEKAIMMRGQQIVLKDAGDVMGEGMILCPSCKTQNSKDSKFCKKCGSPLSNECPNCHAPLEAGSLFCSQCGQKL